MKAFQLYGKQYTQCLVSLLRLSSFAPKCMSTQEKPGAAAKPVVNVLLSQPVPKTGPKRTFGRWLKDYLRHTLECSKLACREVKWLCTSRSLSQISPSDIIKKERVKNDLGKLVPFFFIVVIPFAELCLPFYLAIYQNCIPSQYFSKVTKEKHNYDAAVALEKCRTELKTLAEDHLRYLKTVSKDAYLTTPLPQIEKMLKKGYSSISKEELVELGKKFEDTFWKSFVSSPLVLNKSVKMTGKGPITGAYYINKALALAGIHGPTMESFIFSYIFSPLLRYRFKRSINLIAKFDKTMPSYDSVPADDLITLSLMRGISPLNRTYEDVKSELVEWQERAKSGVPTSLLFFSQLCKTQTK